MINEEKYLQSIATKLRKARVSRGKTQEEVALDVGMARSYISELENGHKNPSVISLKKISISLGVDIRDLIE